MRFLVWLFRAFLFFALFAFALNNQHDASVKWFFGQEWRAPMVFIVLVAFGLARGAAAALAAAFAVQYVGLLGERWYFFAQANHPQNLYYQAIS